MSLTRLLERLEATDVAALDVGGVSAASSTPEQFRRHVDRVVDQLAADRGLARSERQRRSATLANGINRDTGMYWLHAELDRLLPACTRHHHLAHEGGWQLELDPSTRELTVRLPDATLHCRGRPGLTPDRPAGQTPPWLRRRATCAETARTVGGVA